MRTNWEGRIIRLETLWQWLLRELDQLRKGLTAVQQAQRQTPGIAYQWGGSGSGSSYSDGIVVTEISACDGTSYGTGQVQLYATEDGAEGSGGTTVDVLSWFSKVGEVGAHCGVIKQADGYWRLIVLDCPPVSE